MHKPSAPTLHSLLLAAVAGTPVLLPTDDDKVTYDDTPQLPGQPYKVHADRPWPTVVAPAAQVGAAPADAVVLFDGSNLDAWRGGKGEAAWALEDGAMVVNGTGTLTTRQEFGDVQLHLEAPVAVELRAQAPDVAAVQDLVDPATERRQRCWVT